MDSSALHEIFRAIVAGISESAKPIVEQLYEGVLRFNSAIEAYKNYLKTYATALVGNIRATVERLETTSGQLGKRLESLEKMQEERFEIWEKKHEERFEVWKMRQEERFEVWKKNLEKRQEERFEIWEKKQEERFEVWKKNLEKRQEERFEIWEKKQEKRFKGVEKKYDDLKLDMNRGFREILSRLDSLRVAPAHASPEQGAPEGASTQ